MSDDTKPTLAQLAPQIYKATTDNITFSKKQQWAITNYTVLVYAALVGLAKSFGGGNVCERVLMTFAAVLTVSVATVLLVIIQRDLGKFRARLGSIQENFLNEPDRQVMHIEPYGNRPWQRGVMFVGALIGVVALGFLLVVWSLWRSMIVASG